jgi:hypothetical protein
VHPHLASLIDYGAGLVLGAAFFLAACGPRDRDGSDYLADWRSAARFYCIGDGLPGGELAACQALVRAGDIPTGRR